MKSTRIRRIHLIPQCEQDFFFKPMNALISIEYRRIYLQNWESIQAKWERLLQSFIPTSSIDSQENGGEK